MASGEGRFGVLMRCYFVSYETILRWEGLRHMKEPQTMIKRKYLTQQEVVLLQKAVKPLSKHYAHRNTTLIQLMFHHGFRISEVLSLQWDQVDFENGHLHVRRLKNGRPSTHPMTGETMRMLRRLHRESGNISPFVFISQRRSILTSSLVQKLLREAGEKAGFSFKVHPHMLRHATGYYLANKGIDTRAIQDYLGHVNIHHTVRYTQLNANRFKGFFERGGVKRSKET